MRSAIISAGLALAMAFASSTAAASSMRCGNDLVRKGDHISEVHGKCGPPATSTVLENKYGAAVGKQELYDNVRGSRDRLVTYHGDRVVRIEILR